MALDFLKVTNLIIFPDFDVTQLQRLTIAVLKNNRARLNVAVWEKELRLSCKVLK